MRSILLIAQTLEFGWEIIYHALFVRVVYNILIISWQSVSMLESWTTRDGNRGDWLQAFSIQCESWVIQPPIPIHSHLIPLKRMSWCQEQSTINEIYMSLKHTEFWSDLKFSVLKFASYYSLVACGAVWIIS